MRDEDQNEENYDDCYYDEEDEYGDDDMDVYADEEELKDRAPA